MQSFSMNLLINVIVGLLSSIVLAAGAYVVGVIRNKRVEKKYPISGEYITEFENEKADGTPIISVAPATLRQRGRKVTGTTMMTEDGRQWGIEAHISKSGWMYGIYYSHNPHDKGFGNFFLSIEESRRLDGFWSGYGQVGKKILAGHYRFIPVFKDYVVTDIAPRAVPQIVAMMEEDLTRTGIREDIPQLVRRNVESKDTHLGEMLVSEALGVLGVVLCSVRSFEELKDILPIPDKEIPQAIKHASKIGFIEGISIRESHRRRGVGTALLERCLENLKKRDVEVICVVLARTAGEASSTFLRRNGFDLYQPAQVEGDESTESVISAGSADMISTRQWELYALYHC